MTKQELETKIQFLENKLSDTEQALKIAQEEVETHKRASYQQNKQEQDKQLERDKYKMELEKVTIAYNEMAQIFDDYIKVTRNSLKQLEGLTQASVMLEDNLTQKIKNFNKGDNK